MTIMIGVLNVTPNSFSDGGRHDGAGTVVTHGRFLASRRAGIVDVGGESTRPGAVQVLEAEEMTRMIPVIAALAAHEVTCSMGTIRVSVAWVAVVAGARIVNDVSGGLADPGMLGVVTDFGVNYIAMRWHGHSEVVQQHTNYTDVIANVAAEFAARHDAALTVSTAAKHTILDSRIRFAKTSEQNWRLLRGLGILQAMGHRLLVGVNRKRFLGGLLDDRPATDRNATTVAVTTWYSLHGIWAVRIHEVPAQRDAAQVGWRFGAQVAG